MKVNGNDSIYQFQLENGRVDIRQPMPLRLEIASRILAGMFAKGFAINNPDIMTGVALNYADALISNHNETQGGEHE